MNSTTDRTSMSWYAAYRMYAISHDREWHSRSFIYCLL